MSKKWDYSMRTILLSLIFIITSCTTTAPSYQYLRGGELIQQPGVAFVLPEEKSWIAMMRSTYVGTFGASQMPNNETLIVGVRVYNAPKSGSPEEFLEAIKRGRAAEPKTGRFEKIRNIETLYNGRPETCAMHQSASKDFGIKAKRGGEYSILETFGMNCIHPLNPQVGVLIELSRKAPPGTEFLEFDSMAKSLLKSVQFGEF